MNGGYGDKMNVQRLNPNSPRYSRRLWGAWSLVALLTTPLCHAARPMLTDDARVVDAGHCQLESWTVKPVSGTEQWGLPACSGGPGTEWALGGQRVSLDGSSSAVVNGIAQYKRMLHDLGPGGVGVAAAIGSLHIDGRAAPYFYLPISWMSPTEGTLLHLNVGRASTPLRSLADTTWGLGLEQRISDSVWLIAERYSPAAAQWQAQAGLRWWLVPGTLQVDATAGQQHQAAVTSRFASMGLRWIFRKPFQTGQ